MMLQQVLLLKLLLILSQYNRTYYAATQTNSSGKFYLPVTVIISSLCNNTGVYLMYKGEIFPNNSVILYDYGSNVSIHCVTNLRPCCTAPQQGEWYEPHYWDSERNVSSERISRSDNGTISMFPIRYIVGLHHCVLPNATNTVQHIYFGVYKLYDPCKTIIIENHFILMVYMTIHSKH